MRLIFATLLLMNLAYGAYVLKYKRSDAKSGSGASSELVSLRNIDGIVMFSELSGSQQLRHESSVALRSKSAPEQHLSPDVEGALSQAEIVEALIANPIVESADVEPFVGLESGPVKPQEKLLVDDGLPLITLGRGECEVLGPFDDFLKGQGVESRLASRDGVVLLKAVDHELPDRDFRVLLPPEKSAPEAFRKLRELKSRGVDSYVITKGKDKLAISLGVFSTRSAAEKLKAAIAAKGYGPKIMDILKYQRLYWIFPGGGARLNLNDEILVELRETDPEIALSKKQCPQTIKLSAN